MFDRTTSATSTSITPLYWVYAHTNSTFNSRLLTSPSYRPSIIATYCSTLVYDQYHHHHHYHHHDLHVWNCLIGWFGFGLDSASSPHRRRKWKWKLNFLECLWLDDRMIEILSSLLQTQTPRLHLLQQFNSPTVQDSKALSYRSYPHFFLASRFQALVFPDFETRGNLARINPWFFKKSMISWFMGFLMGFKIDIGWRNHLCTVWCTKGLFFFFFGLRIFVDTGYGTIHSLSIGIGFICLFEMVRFRKLGLLSPNTLEQSVNSIEQLGVRICGVTLSVPWHHHRCARKTHDDLHFDTFIPSHPRFFTHVQAEDCLWMVMWYKQTQWMHALMILNKKKHVMSGQDQVLDFFCLLFTVFIVWKFAS